MRRVRGNRAGGASNENHLGLTKRYVLRCDSLRYLRARRDLAGIYLTAAILLTQWHLLCLKLGAFHMVEAVWKESGLETVAARAIGCLPKLIGMIFLNRMFLVRRSFILV